MNILKKATVLVFLIVLLMYVCNITMLPSEIVIIQGEKLNFNTIFGISVQTTNKTKIYSENNNYQTLQASSNLNKSKIEQLGQLDLSVNLFNSIPVKNITVSVIPKTTVIPVGKAIGMKLYTEGVLVVGMSEINGKRPYEKSGIKEGDRIIQINNCQISSTDDLIESVNSSNGETLTIKYIREEETVTTSIKPVKTDDNNYKIGLWVRDAAAGVGTLTFYEPSTGMFGALGHGITDIDTSELISIANGELVTTSILSIVKGQKGKPGEIRGTIEAGIEIGEIYKNTYFGVYGNLNNKTKLNIDSSKEMEVALRSEIQEGKAEIICELENGKQKSYEIEIQKIYINNNENNKSMLIKIIDEELIEKTGGIIQGMSGAPIVQNGKFCGAVTHVLVNDPTTGYGVFADMMLKQMRDTN